MTAGRRVRLTPADAELFMRASHDRNPLHWDDGRFAANPFGQPVVHGVLSVLGLLGAGERRGGATLTRIACRFLGPVFPQQKYTSAFTGETPERTVARLRDGHRVLVEATADYGFRLSATRAEAVRTLEAAAPRREPAAWTWSELATGRAVRTAVSSLPIELDELVARFGLNERGVDRDQVAALAWCSYLIGMEMPGIRALFSGFSAAFGRRHGPGLSAMNGQASVVRLLSENRSVELTGAVEVGHTSARLDLSAYVGP